MKLELLAALNAERAARRAAVVVTDVEAGRQRLVEAADVVKDSLRPLLARHIAHRQKRHGSDRGRPRLPHRLRAGAATGHHRRMHISQALAPIGKLLGYDVTIVDPHTAFPRRSASRTSK